MLLTTLRKTLSLITLQRISDKVDSSFHHPKVDFGADGQQPIWYGNIGSTSLCANNTSTWSKYWVSTCHVHSIHSVERNSWVFCIRSLIYRTSESYGFCCRRQTSPLGLMTRCLPRLTQPLALHKGIHCLHYSSLCTLKLCADVSHTTHQPTLASVRSNICRRHWFHLNRSWVSEQSQRDRASCPGRMVLVCRCWQNRAHKH